MSFPTDPHSPDVPGSASALSVPGGSPIPLALSALAPPEMWLDDMRRANQAPESWLWQGYLASGKVTLLTSQWKSGKTTLLSILLDHMKSGGTLAALPVMAGKAAVISEESSDEWLKRSANLDFGNHVCWFCQPFVGKPSHEQWLALLARVLDVHARHGLSLVVIDSLSTFFPGRGECNAEIMLEFLTTLRRLTTQGLCVLLLHHPNKAEVAAGLMARGSGVLGSFADVIIEQTYYTSASDTDRRRRLVSLSRSTETPRQLVIELTADGTDYAGLGSFEEAEYTQNWERIRAVLSAAPQKLTRQQIRRSWPADAEPPESSTLWRWLDRAVSQRVLLREGTGRKNDPFRYWLPGDEERLKQPPWQQEMDELIERMNRLGGETPATGSEGAA
jgi:archaellum biogenesis ATPase FlaH